MQKGNDMPGRILRRPGGVAYNIAQCLTRFGLNPILLTAVGCDPDGDALLAHCASMDMQTQYVHRSQGWPTDNYMAIEDDDGLVAAIADAHTLEAAGEEVLTALHDGRLGTSTRPFNGVVILDGNLSQGLLQEIATSPIFRACDLRVAPASPGKAERLSPFFNMPNATFYVNRHEAEILCQKSLDSAEPAAAAMLERGAKRALVTDSAAPVCDGFHSADIITQPVPKVAKIAQVTGAGDTLLAAHIHAELMGADRTAALHRAVQAASRYVHGETENV